jgi:transcriptional antiterminator NusG
LILAKRPRRYEYVRKTYGFIGIVFEPGEELLVIDGPFTDFKGVVEEVLYEKSRLTLTINVFNRPTQVELEFRQVEKSV